jgi:hypothetical protein
MDYFISPQSFRAFLSMRRATVKSMQSSSTRLSIAAAGSTVVDIGAFPVAPNEIDRWTMLGCFSIDLRGHGVSVMPTTAKSIPLVKRWSVDREGSVEA